MARKKLAANYAKRSSPLDDLDIGDEATSEDAASYGIPEDDEWSKKRKSKNRNKRRKMMQDCGSDEKKRQFNPTGI